MTTAPSAQPAASIPTPPGKALVLGWDPRSFLAVVRSLGRRGVEVHTAWCPDDSPVLRSRYIRRHHPLPAWHAGDAWLEPLIALLRRERFDLVLPCHDETQIPLARHRKTLEPLARLALPEARALELAADKWGVTTLAATLEIPVPRGELARDAEAAREAASRLGWPVVLKPPRSYDPADLRRRHAVAKVYTARALEEPLAECLIDGPVIVQENFIGEGVGIEVLADRGELLFAFQHRRLHEPPHGGGGSYRRSERLDPELHDAARRLVRALDYTGIAMIEFKKNFADGRWVLLEINARPWGSLPLAVAAGADFPWFLYELLVHGRRAFPPEYRLGLHARNLRLDVPFWVHNMRTDRHDPTLARVPLTRLAGEALNLLTLRERFDELTLDDPGPAVGLLVECARKAWDSLAVRLRFAIWRLPPVRRRLAERACRALAGAHRVLLVSRDDRLRGPYAAARARAAWPSATVESMGVYAESGRIPFAAALRVAGVAGVDVAGHRARSPEPAALEQADAILAMDARTYKTLARWSPACRGRLYPLGVFDPAGPLSIPPAPADDSRAIARLYARLDRAIESAAGAIGGNLPNDRHAKPGRP